MSYSESSGDFMRYLAEMLGQEFVWSPFRRWGRGEGGRVAVASMSVSRRVDRVPAQDHFLFGAPEQKQWRGEICTEYWPCGNEKITVGIHDKAPVQPCKEPDYFLLFFPELQGNQSARTTDCEKFRDRDSSPQKGTSTPFSTYHRVERSSGDMIGGEELFHLKSAKMTHELRQKSSPTQESVRLAGQLDMDTMSFHQKHPQPSGTGATFMCPVPVA